MSIVTTPPGDSLRGGEHQADHQEQDDAGEDDDTGQDIDEICMMHRSIVAASTYRADAGEAQEADGHQAGEDKVMPRPRSPSGMLE